MKQLFFILLAALLFSCIQPTSPVIDTTEPVAEQPTDPLLTNDPRLQMVSASSTKWLRLPSTSRGIADGDPIAAYCTDPGWSYIFYDDMAVIGYEPLPDNYSVMHWAVSITVESHNMEFPEAQWDFINVAMPGPPPPVTTNDPTLEPWQYCLCLDDGSIVDGPYTAEFQFNWDAWKSGGAVQQRDSYNLEHGTNAHIVWGPEKE